MKKVLCVLGLIMTLSLPAAALNDEVTEVCSVVYSPKTKTWAIGRIAPDKIAFKKKTSPGTGSYSEYYSSTDGTFAFTLSSNYEFIRGQKLIAVNNNALKFSEVIYKDGKFQEKELKKRDIQKLFPYTKIIKISSFKNQKITIKPDKFPQQYLLWNNTDKYFHKYSFKKIDTDMPYIKGSFRVSRKGEIIFSHFGEDKYIIIVK